MKTDGTPTLPATAAPASPATAERFRLLALAALTALLIGLSLVLAVPFLPAITWGVALAIIAWPMHRRIADRVAWPGLAAALSTVVVVLLIVVPGMFVSYQLAREAGSAA